ncbi:tyrosine-type recombinase/integrase [Halalkalibacter urbisdiaboli]|uniref:tyrosine-type recombinase/integrase n=1 Tax=Halalkalibacter urbisdiaboli TaxID=1960589 RepID=UPI002477F01C|nr:tyrosine-type recombinase/integrase [Halalkalibacter urbisdiaboli]
MLESGSVRQIYSKGTYTRYPKYCSVNSCRERLVPIQSRMKEQLRKYIAVRGNAVTDSLFITDGTALSKRQIQNRLSSYGKKTGINGVRVSCRTLRHTFAKQMFIVILLSKKTNLIFSSYL